MSRRTDIAAEIARIESATPSRVASFAKAREERLAALRAELAALPEEVAPFDAAAEAQCARFDASSPANRRRDRWA